MIALYLLLSTGFASKGDATSAKTRSMGRSILIVQVVRGSCRDQRSPHFCIDHSLGLRLCLLSNCCSVSVGLGMMTTISPLNDRSLNCVLSNEDCRIALSMRCIRGSWTFRVSHLVLGWCKVHTNCPYCCRNRFYALLCSDPSANKLYRDSRCNAIFSLACGTFRNGDTSGSLSSTFCPDTSIDHDGQASNGRESGCQERFPGPSSYSQA